MLAKLKLIMNHQRYEVVATVIVIGFIGFVQGCQSKCQSMIDSSKQVSRGELKAEVDLLLARANDRVATLDQQDGIKKAIFENALLFSSGGKVNPVGLFMTCLSILGFGAVVDNFRRRKDSNP